MRKSKCKVGAKLWIYDDACRVSCGVVAHVEERLAVLRLARGPQAGSLIGRPFSYVFASVNAARVYGAEFERDEARRLHRECKRAEAKWAHAAAAEQRRLAKAEARLAALRAKAGK